MVRGDGNSGFPCHRTTVDWWDEVTLTTQPGSDQELKFVCTPTQHRSGTCIPLRSWRNKSKFRILCRSRLLRILVRRSGLAGSFDKQYPTPRGEAVPPSTSHGKCFPSPIFSAYAYQLNFDDSDLGYMATSGPCPILKVSSQSALFVFGDADLRPVGTNNKHRYRLQIRSGALDIAMIPIWRGGTLSVIARLGFRVHFFLLSPTSQPFLCPQN